MCSFDLRRQRERGITLVELWMGMAVSSVVVLVLLSFTLYAAKSFAALTNYVDLEQKSQIALDTITRDIRQTQYMQSYGTATLNGQLITNTVTFMDSDNQPLTFTFENSVLKRIKGGASTMLLTNCDYLSFQIFQRNPVGGTYDQYPTGIPANCKIVSVTWLCSRTILGSKMNTESVQTAKVVIRKE